MASNMTLNNFPPAPLKMSPSGAETFKKAVHYIFTEWPALDLAIENGMGGSQAKEKRDWMCRAVADVLLKEKDIDLEDYIGEMINQEFDTLIEDGSLEYNIKWIHKFYKDCLQGKEQEVTDSIDQASRKKLSLGNIKIPPPVCQTQDTSEDEDENDDEVEM